MAKKLMLVESPRKVRLLSSYLRADWRVEATRGHVRDLPQDKLGIEIEQDFRPLYEVPTRQANTVRRLIKAMREAEAVYVATDPDREGEAISWHILQLANLLPDKPVYRVTFTAITENAVKAAIAAPRSLDLNLIEAQQTRRVVDRLVGYLISPLACQMLDGRYSAGRVQSACLRLVVERERQITAFTPETYWALDARLSADTGEFDAHLSVIKGQKVERLSHEQVEKFMGGMQDAAFWVRQIVQNTQVRHPQPPFTTSTLQQAASSALGLSPERTMQIAQTLYEAGLITYHRTDGVSTAPEAVAAVRRLIASTYGGDYVPNEPVAYEAKAKHAQEAHEGIRPADVTHVPQEVEGDGAALYALIWKRFVASQMAPAGYAVQTIPIWVGKTAGQPYPLLFQAKGRSLLFDGFLKVYQEPSDPDAEPEEDTALPALKIGTVLHLVKWLPIERHTQAPPRFTEASLVHELERLGIGRPSTYASIVQTLKERGYATVDHKRFVPTETGVKLSDFLNAYFSEFFATSYTAQLEAALDTIAQGETTRLAVLQAFWTNFSTLVGAAGRAAQANRQLSTTLGELCPVCGGDLVERSGAHGKFIGCMNYPDCAYTRGLEHKPVLLRSRTS